MRRTRSSCDRGAVRGTGKEPASRGGWRESCIFRKHSSKKGMVLGLHRDRKQNEMGQKEHKNLNAGSHLGEKPKTESLPRLVTCESQGEDRGSKHRGQHRKQSQGNGDFRTIQSRQETRLRLFLHELSRRRVYRY